MDTPAIVPAAVDKKKMSVGLMYVSTKAIQPPRLPSGEQFFHETTMEDYLIDPEGRDSLFGWANGNKAIICEFYLFNPSMGVPGIILTQELSPAKQSFCPPHFPPSAN